MAQHDIPRLQEAILQVIQTQIQKQEPPETEETLLRLIDEGFTRSQALDLIGYVVAAQVLGALREGKPYLEARYITALKALPKLPWEVE